MVAVAAGVRRGHRRLANLAKEPSAGNLVFAGLVLVGVAFVLLGTTGSSFFNDDWDFIVTRQAWTLDNLTRPLNPNLELLPVLIYKLMLSAFGATSFLPWRGLAALDMILGTVVGAGAGRATGHARSRCYHAAGPGQVSVALAVGRPACAGDAVARLTRR